MEEQLSALMDKFASEERRSAKKTKLQKRDIVVFAAILLRTPSDFVLRVSPQTGSPAEMGKWKLQQRKLSCQLSFWEPVAQEGSG